MLVLAGDRPLARSQPAHAAGRPPAPAVAPTVAVPSRPPAPAVAPTVAAPPGSKPSRRVATTGLDDALGMLLRRSVQDRAATPGDALLQRKTTEERATKHRRKARAQATIALLGDNLKDGLDRHVFKAMPVTKALDKDDPTGLHAYTDGELPDGVAGDVLGNENTVHSLRWHWTGHETHVKDSTMFPKWMPAEHVRTLIALQYPTERKAAVAAELLSPTDTKTYITRGTRVVLSKAGETIYPVL